jgi:hypothetical protein
MFDLPRQNSSSSLTTTLSSLQRSFYVTIGAFASAYVLYRLSKSAEESGSQSWISNLIQKWTPSEKLFEERNAIHTALMEKAAQDRHLLQSQGPRATFELKQPEYVHMSSLCPAQCTS